AQRKCEQFNCEVPMKITLVIPMAAVMFCAGFSVGCKKPDLYVWGNYEPSLYSLAKNPAAMEKYGESLRILIVKGEAKQKVPPGIYAEYGYYLIQVKKQDEALKYFQKEKERWPESTVLMDRMIKL